MIRPCGTKLRQFTAEPLARSEADRMSVGFKSGLCAWRASLRYMPRLLYIDLW